MRTIAQLQLRESARTLFAEREVTLRWADEVADFLLEHGGFSPQHGARGMRQAIQRFVEGPISEDILTGQLAFGDTALLRCDSINDVLEIERHTLNDTPEATASSNMARASADL